MFRLLLLKECTCKNVETLVIAELGAMGKIGNIVKMCVIMFYLKHSVLIMILVHSPFEFIHARFVNKKVKCRSFGILNGDDKTF